MTTDHSIDVYTISRTDDVRNYDEHFALLSGDEKERAAKFKFDRHRVRWVNSRASLRLVLAEHAEVSARNVKLITRPDGKPELGNSDRNINARSGKHHANTPSLFFNLSHSGSHVLIAVSPNHEIGCDVEHVKRIRDWPAVTRRFFSTAEQEEIENVDADQKTYAFYCCWTRKEAVIKTTGEGLRASLSSFDVSLTPGEPAIVRADRNAGEFEPPWHLVHVDAGSDYVGAVALRANTAPVVRIHTHLDAAIQ